MSTQTIKATTLATIIVTFALLASIGIASAATDVNVQSIIPAYNPQLDAVQAPTGVFGTGTVWHVGPSEQYKSFAAIAPQLGNGDVVEVDAGTYGCSEQSIVWTANDISVIGVGGRPVFNLTGCSISGDKGIFNPRGTNMIVDNIEFVGASGPSGNDAGIRLDGGGYVYLTNDYFHDNQDGVLLTPGVASNIVIDHSEFAHNGTGTGQTHNIYVGNANADSFVMRFSYSHDAIVGHEVKSRAKANYILYNRLADEAAGNASYEIDLPQGGLSYIIGNVLQKGLKNQNNSVIEYAGESNPNPVQKLFVAYNTIVDTAGGGHALFITDQGLSQATMSNNLIVGADEAIGSGASKVEKSNDLMTSTPGFTDAANRVYALEASSPAIDKGTDPGTMQNGTSLKPAYYFVSASNSPARPVFGALDIGAYEYIGSQSTTSTATTTSTGTRTSSSTSTAVQATSTDATSTQATNGTSTSSSSIGQTLTGTVGLGTTQSSASSPMESERPSKIGQKVRASDRVRVHRNSSVSARNVQCIQTPGKAGTILTGPIKKYGFILWKVKFTSGCSGWVASEFLSAR